MMRAGGLGLEAGKRAISSSLPRLSARLEGFDKPTVWHEFTPLAKENNAVNLGQGFPDWPAPAFVKEAMCNAVMDDHNQYTRSAGAPSLVTELAERYTPLLGQEIDALTEVVVSVGATEAIFATLQAHVNPGDEVILFEPAFDIYPAQVQMAGGTVKRVPLRYTPPADGAGTAEHFSFDVEELAAAFSPRTRAIIMNSPHNPTGKIFTKKELESVAALVSSHSNVVVLSDEVYEAQIYDNTPYTRFATLPGMWDRTVTISSAGKMFSITGWKIGWCIGPASLIHPIMLAQQWVQFSVSTPAQEAVAAVFKKAKEPYEGHSSYYDYVQALYTGKRQKLEDMLRASGISPIRPQGGFFVMGDTSNLNIPSSYIEEAPTRDWACCRWLTKDVGVAAIPPSAFYAPPSKQFAASLARFAFCKTDEALDEAAARLKKNTSF